MVVGHQYLVKDFKELIKRGRLAHSYIFFGEPEVGKFYFAKHLANLLENDAFELSGRPLQDALILENVRGIEEMRKLKKNLWEKPIFSPKKLAVINNAENLTPEAQNAILKITEEPPDSAVLILIVNQLDNIIPTLLSRSQKIYFGRLSDKEMANLLQTVKLPVETGSGTPHRNEYIISGAWGRPGRAMRLLDDQLTKDAQKYAQGFLRSSGLQRSKIIKELVDGQKERPDLLNLFFEEVILELRKDPKKNTTLLKSVLHRFFLIKSYNVNKRLQLEAL